MTQAQAAKADKARAVITALLAAINAQTLPAELGHSQAMVQAIENAKKFVERLG